MNFIYKECKQIKFPVRDCTFTWGDKTIHRLIGSEIMCEVIFDEKGNFYNKDAEVLDSQIAYYIPHDELLKLSDKEILHYIFYHIDSEIYDEF